MMRLLPAHRWYDLFTYAACAVVLAVVALGIVGLAR